MDLGRVDADVAHLLHPALYLDHDGVAVHDPDHQRFEGRAGRLGRGDGAE
jgi:hypothetical protein